MASGDIFGFASARDFTPVNGPQGTPAPLVQVGEIAGLDFRKELTGSEPSANARPRYGYCCEGVIWNNGTPMTTGMTLRIGLVDSPTDGAPGLVVRIGVLAKVIATGGTTDEDQDINQGTEVFATYTTPSVSGKVGELSVAIPKASFGGSTAAAGNRFLLQIRRDGLNAADTHTGRVVMTGVIFADT